MACVFLVRHGAVEGNVEGNIAGGGDIQRTFVGWRDVPLTPRGEQQARAVAARLSGETLHAVYASDLRRTLDTAERIARPHGLLVRPERDLRETNYGAWEGLGARELERDWSTLWRQRRADPLHVAAPQGESLAQVWERVLPIWRSILRAHYYGDHDEDRDENIVIVGHNGPLRLLLCHLLGAPLHHYGRLQIDNGALTRLQVTFKPDFRPDEDEPEIRVLSINETDFIEDFVENSNEI